VTFELIYELDTIETFEHAGSDSLISNFKV